MILKSQPTNPTVTGQTDTKKGTGTLRGSTHSIRGRKRTARNAENEKVEKRKQLHAKDVGKMKKL